MKKWLISIIILLIVTIVGFVIWHKHSQKVQPIPTVSVTYGDITEKAEAVGYIKPMHYITIKSQVAGTVAKIFHHEGDFVKKGEPLLEVKPAPEPTTYAIAYHGAQTAKADASSAKYNLDRYKDALKSGLITRNYSELIAAKKSYDDAVIARKLAEQKLTLLISGKIRLANIEVANIVKSPVNGYVLNRIVDVGDAVISLSSYQSSTSLFTMANMNDMMFEGSVDEIDASKIKKKMKANVSIGAYPNKKIPGTLTQLALQSENENQAQGVTDQNLTNSPFNVGFQIQNTGLKLPHDIKLRSGYSATANILIRTKKHVLLLPERVIHFDSDNNDKPFVYLPTTPGEKSKKQYVTLGISDGVKAEITKGLSSGQVVVDQQNTDTDKKGSK